MWRGTQGPKVSGKKRVYGVQALFHALHPKGGEWNNVTDHELSKFINPHACVGIIW